MRLAKLFLEMLNVCNSEVSVPVKWQEQQATRNYSAQVAKH